MVKHKHDLLLDQQAVANIAISDYRNYYEKHAYAKQVCFFLLSDLLTVIVKRIVPYFKCFIDIYT